MKEFWLRIEWAPTQKFKVYGTDHNSRAGLVYNNWDQAAMEKFEELPNDVFRSVSWFYISADTGKWGWISPFDVWTKVNEGVPIGVICEFGKFLREFYRGHTDVTYMYVQYGLLDVLYRFF